MLFLVPHGESGDRESDASARIACRSGSSRHVAPDAAMWHPSTRRIHTRGRHMPLRPSRNRNRWGGRPAGSDNPLGRHDAGTCSGTARVDVPPWERCFAHSPCAGSGRAALTSLSSPTEVRIRFRAICVSSLGPGLDQQDDLTARDGGADQIGFCHRLHTDRVCRLLPHLLVGIIEQGRQRRHAEARVLNDIMTEDIGGPFPHDGVTGQGRLSQIRRLPRLIRNRGHHAFEKKRTKLVKSPQVPPKTEPATGVVFARPDGSPIFHPQIRPAGCRLSPRHIGDASQHHGSFFPHRPLRPSSR